MKQLKKLSPLVLALFMVSCAGSVVTNAQKSIKATHQAVYGLYQIEVSSYPFFKEKAPEQAKQVRRQVNVLRANYPKVEQDAWNAVEVYRKESTGPNKTNLSVALAVLDQILKDAQGYVLQISQNK